MTSGETLTSSIKLTKVDDSNLSDHAYLTANDECYFLLEYTPGKGYSYGQANSLIANLKKKPSRSKAAELQYKAIAIEKCATYFRQTINMNWLKDATLVPIPPSKAIGDADYDDRITQVCRKISTDTKLDIRELVGQKMSLTASHEGNRHSVDDLLKVYSINENIALPSPTKIAIFDDMLTAGVHYRAMHTILNQKYPNIPIVGFFVTRRIIANPFDIIES